MTRIRASLVALAGVLLVVLALATGPASATSQSATVTIANQAQLLPDGSAVMTIYYVCAPGPGGDTTGMVTGLLQQGNGPTPASGSNTAPATCDNRKQTVYIDATPGPFSQGAATGLAVVQNTSGSSAATTSRGVTIR